MIILVLTVVSLNKCFSFFSGSTLVINLYRLQYIDKPPLAKTLYRVYSQSGIKA